MAGQGANTSLRPLHRRLALIRFTGRLRVARGTFLQAPWGKITPTEGRITKMWDCRQSLDGLGYYSGSIERQAN